MIETNTSTKNFRPLSEKINVNYFFKIFLISLFPTHFWTLLMIFNDLEFVSERTSLWDSIGYAGYSLLFALVESLAIAVLLWIISLAFPKVWNQTRTLSVVGSIYLVIAGASIVDMAAHAFNDVRIAKQYLYGLENFTTLTYFLIIGAILITLSASLVLILKTERGEKVFSDLFDRVMLLSYFYLLLDAIGIVIVVIRNVF